MVKKTKKTHPPRQPNPTRIKEPEALIDFSQVKGLSRYPMEDWLINRDEIKSHIEDKKKELDEVNGRIIEVLKKAGMKTVGVLGQRVTFVAGGPSERFDKKVAFQALVDLGVELKAIRKAWAKATSPGEGREDSLRVTAPKGE